MPKIQDISRNIDHVQEMTQYLKGKCTMPLVVLMNYMWANYRGVYQKYGNSLMYELCVRSSASIPIGAVTADDHLSELGYG